LVEIKTMYCAESHLSTCSDKVIPVQPIWVKGSEVIGWVILILYSANAHCTTPLECTARWSLFNTYILFYSNNTNLLVHHALYLSTRHARMKVNLYIICTWVVNIIICTWVVNITSLPHYKDEIFGCLWESFMFPALRENYRVISKFGNIKHYLRMLILN